MNQIWKNVLRYDGHIITDIRPVKGVQATFYYVAKYVGKHEEKTGENTSCDNANRSNPVIDSAQGGNRDYQESSSQRSGAIQPLVSEANKGGIAPNGASGIYSLVNSAYSAVLENDKITHEEEESRTAVSSSDKNSTTPDNEQHHPPQAESCTDVDGDCTEEPEEDTGDHSALLGRSWGVLARKKLPYAEFHVAKIRMDLWFHFFREEAGELYPPLRDISGRGFTLFSPNDAVEWIHRANELSQSPLPESTFTSVISTEEHARDPP